MPTPVVVARQCLTPEAAHILDEAITVARRRGHSQTTSVHAVSALLSLPSSLLRDACARARNTAYSSRLHFKALDLCLHVSLDRIPFTHHADDPPVSNSLMAAIKRSQANQRRQPENRFLYHQISHQSSSSSVPCIKVELRHFILSILDDPVVSRLFADAGFCSSEIKLAMVGTLPTLQSYSKSRFGPPLPCNYTERSDPIRRSLCFSFPGLSEADVSRRICEILSRNNCNNPLLVGACALDELWSFTEGIRKRKNSVVLPAKLSGLSVISMGESISKYVHESDNDRGTLNLIQMVNESMLGPLLVVNLGDLKAFVDEQKTDEAVSNVVAQVTKLLELNTTRDKLWLMGAATNYECYLKFVRRFPSIEKDWDLQLLPITSLKHAMAQSCHERKPSLMDSFVPLGGFFSEPSDFLNSMPGACQYIPKCQLRYDNCEEVTAVMRENVKASAIIQHHYKFPSWFETTKHVSGKDSSMKTIDDGPRLNFEDVDLHKQKDAALLISDHQKFLGHKTENPTNQFLDPSQSDSRSLNFNSYSNMNSHKISTSQSSSPSLVFSKANNSENLRKVADLHSGGLGSCCLSISSIGDLGQVSHTDLGLGMCSSTSSSTPKYSTKQSPMVHPENVLSCFSANVNSSKTRIADPVSSSTCSTSDCFSLFEPRALKKLIATLTAKVSWQDEAVNTIGRILALSRTTGGKSYATSQRGGLWLNFVGPDRFGKKKIAIALAEFLYDSWENFIFVELSSIKMKGCDARFRGKTTVDYIAGELSRKPLSVVFLENVDEADVVEQNCLSQAVRTGKISNSHGREVSISNAIFVTCSSGSSTSSDECCNFSEEVIMRVKASSMQLTVDQNVGKSLCEVNHTKEVIPNLFVSKRKSVCDLEHHEDQRVLETAKRVRMSPNLNLDLNIPADENDMQHIDDWNTENGSVTVSQYRWLQDLFDQMDETVVFKPFNVDAFAESMLTEIKKTFHAILGFHCALVIESEVMGQLLSAAYFSERHREVEDWIEQVLSKGFSEAQQRYNLTGDSIVKLSTCEGAFTEKQIPSAHLPSRIFLN